MGHAVRLKLFLRRFFCQNPECQRKIFAERLPNLVAPYARRTLRLHDLLTLIGFVVGAEVRFDVHANRAASLLGNGLFAQQVERLRGRGCLTVHEMARQLGVCAATVYTLGHTGTLTQQRYGKGQRYLYEPLNGAVFIRGQGGRYGSTKARLVVPAGRATRFAKHIPQIPSLRPGDSR